MKQLKVVGLAALAAMALTAFGASSASATVLEVGGEAKNEKVTITASLASGTSSVLKNTGGTIQNTCTASHVHGNTESPYSSTFVTAPVTSLSFTSCTRNVTVHKAGKLYVEHISSTTNGTVYSEEAEVTVAIPLFGYLTCETGAGTHIGTLTGVKEGHATMHVNAVLPCGITANWEATYTVTSPTGLGTIAEAPPPTTLEVEGEAKNEQVTLTTSLAGGTSSILRNTSGLLQNTCTASHVHGNTESPYTGTRVTGSVPSLSFTSCTRTVTVHKAGKLYVEHIAGTTNGTVSSEEAEVTVGAPLVGYLTCKTGTGTHLGTLTGSAAEHATMHLSAILPCGISGVWEANYTVTSPTGLGVSA